MINHEQNIKNVTQITDLRRGNKPEELFQTSGFRDEVNKTKNISKVMRMKKEKNRLRYTISKFRLLIGFRAIKKTLLLKVLLMKLKLVKQLFVLELEQGEELYIPRDL